MKRCVIFCAAGFDGLALPIEADDLVIAADGGLRHTQAIGLTPTLILGDFDSLEKDDTDAMLAVREGLARGCTEFFFYGSLDGKRLDHTIANFQTLQFLADRGATGYLIGEEYLVTVVKNGSLRFPATATGILSLFCLGNDARGVTLEGVKYPLTDGTLTPGFPLGVSNHFVGAQATVSVREGSLLVLWDRKNGFPQRN